VTQCGEHSGNISEAVMGPSPYFFSTHNNDNDESATDQNRSKVTAEGLMMIIITLLNAGVYSPTHAQCMAHAILSLSSYSNTM
jgi:hypothetical protein